MEARWIEGCGFAPCPSQWNAVMTHSATGGQHPPSTFEDKLSQKQHFLVIVRGRGKP